MSLFDVFGGGGASGSIGSSANTTSNTTDNKNNATSGDNAAIYDTRGGNISFLDANAIKEAFTFASDSLAKAAAITTTAQEAKDKAARDSLQAVVDLSTQQQKSGAQALTENVIKWGVAGLAIVGAVLAFSLSKGKK